MRIPCPQCGGEVRLQEAGGFPACPFCGAGLVLDLSGVRPHLLYRPRYPATNVLPLLRRWCDRQGLPAPSIVSPPRLTYFPFWRYVREGPPRLVPAWPTLDVRWADVQIPEAEQVFYDPALVEGAEVVESSVAEAATRQRLPAGDGVKPGELVHVPFFEVAMRIETSRLAVSVEACSGRVYASAMPESVLARRASGVGQLVTMGLGFAVMLAEAALLPPAWLAAPAIVATAFVTYWVTLAGTKGGSA